MPTASAAPAASDVTPGHDAQLAGERALLEIARTALGKGDSAAALDALAKHASRYPRGQMSEEREALAVEALAGAGRMDEARSRGARFRRDFPNSMLMPVVDSALK
jgi:outer membrane protein assembly factor BamD (BamD/ComL family)